MCWRRCICLLCTMGKTQHLLGAHAPARQCTDHAAVSRVDATHSAYELRAVAHLTTRLADTSRVRSGRNVKCCGRRSLLPFLRRAIRATRCRQTSELDLAHARRRNARATRCRVHVLGGTFLPCTHKRMQVRRMRCLTGPHQPAGPADACRTTESMTPGHSEQCVSTHCVECVRVCLYH